MNRRSWFASAIASIVGIWGFKAKAANQAWIDAEQQINRDRIQDFEYGIPRYESRVKAFYLWNIPNRHGVTIEQHFIPAKHVTPVGPHIGLPFGGFKLGVFPSDSHAILAALDCVIDARFMHFVGDGKNVRMARGGFYSGNQITNHREQPNGRVT